MNRRPGTNLRIAGWVAASSVSVVVGVGMGAGTASAAPADASGPDSSSTHEVRSSTDTTDAPRDATPTTPSPDGAAADTEGNEEETSPEPVERNSNTATEPQGRRSAHSATVTNDPDVQVSPAGELDEEPPAEAADRQTNSEQDDVKPAAVVETVNPAVAQRNTTASTASRSETTDHESSAVELTMSPKTVSAVQTLVDIAQREGNTTYVAKAAADAAAGLESTAKKLYTGQPSLIQQAVVFVLRVVNAVLSPFGGILAFTGLKVPIFADGVPPFFLTSGLDVQHDKIAGMPVYVLTPRAPTGATVVALHGGAYAAEASLFHWEMYADMARKTGATVIVPDYPLIGEPGGRAEVVVPQTAELISKVMATNGAENTYILGDSAGGGLALAAVQLLVAGGAAATPRRMVLLAPWIDATVSDRASSEIWDPLLNVATLRRDGAAWARGLEEGPANPWASPINGSLDGLPPITVYSGSLDLLSPQALRLRERAIAEGADITFVLRNGLMHDYPIFFFLPDAGAERSSIYHALLGDDDSV